MKANEVLKLLGISRQTLTKYVKSGLIKATRGANSQYDYDRDSVLSVLQGRNAPLGHRNSLVSPAVNVCVFEGRKKGCTFWAVMKALMKCHQPGTSLLFICRDEKGLADVRQRIGNILKSYHAVLCGNRFELLSTGSSIELMVAGPGMVEPALAATHIFVDGFRVIGEPAPIRLKGNTETDIHDPANAYMADFLAALPDEYRCRVEYFATTDGMPRSAMDLFKLIESDKIFGPYLDMKLLSIGPHFL